MLNFPGIYIYQEIHLHQKKIFEKYSDKLVVTRLFSQLSFVVVHIFH